MRPGLYLDENFAAGAHADVLRRGGYDVMVPADVGMLRRSDRLQLGFAAEQRRLFLSYDRKDFSALHRDVIESGEHHAGILIVLRTANYGPGELLRRMNALADVFERNGFGDQILFLSNFG